MATWKLTKKLKETHLSSAFLGRNTDSSRSNTLVPPASASGAAGSGAGPAAGVAGDGDDLKTPRGTVSRSTVTEGSSGSGGAGAGARASASASANASASGSTSASKSGSPAPLSAPPGASVNTSPSLLRIKVCNLANLHIPEATRSQLPTWSFDPKCTRPPPVYLVLEYDKTQIVLHAVGGTCDNPVWDKTSAFDAALEPTSGLHIQAFVRVRREQERQVEDVFVGMASMDVASGSSTLSLSNGGKLKVQTEVHKTRNMPLTIDDFSLLKVVGKGSFGKVMQVRKKDTEQIYALKTLRKAHIVSRSEIGHTLAERTVLAKIKNPFIVPLKFSFQSPEKLYLVLAFVNGGELFHHLQREGRFSLNRARFYTAELLCALECLHEYNVIYRDLKPENILLDYTGHIALCDFGLCKLNMAGQDKTHTFCGTPEYLAPELLLGQGYTKVVDYWTLGVLFYEMLTGLPPFYDQDTNAMYHKILKNPLTFPSDMDQEARSLLTGLLDRDPARRLGVNGASEIKAHPFFRNIDWKCLMNKKYAAPFQPQVGSATDTSNFDKEFTSEVPMDSVVDKDFYLSESVQQQFGGWSYTNTDSKLASSGKW